MHPSHAAGLSAWLRHGSRRPAVEVIAGRRRREPGAVIFETERGNLDASVETQLQEIERGLADRLRRQTDEWQILRWSALSLAPYLADLERLSPLRWTGAGDRSRRACWSNRAGRAVAIGDFCEVQTVGAAGASAPR